MMNFLIIFLGGGTGALLRYVLINNLSYEQNLNIILVNTIGCLLMGALFAYFTNKGEVYTLFSIGVLGSFTTMSTFTHNTFELILDSRYLNAFFYSITMVVICIIANIIGYILIKKLFG
jgi:CrcB protein